MKNLVYYSAANANRIARKNKTVKNIQDTDYKTELHSRAETKA